MYAFHISRRARDRYQFDDSLFSLRGNVLFANFHAARVFAQRINERRDVVNFPEQSVSPGEINAMGLIDEVLHLVVRAYRAEMAPDIMQNALAYLADNVGADATDRLLRRFVDEFPPVAVYRRQTTVNDYLNGVTDGVPNREIALEEMVMLWVANQNPAFALNRELFDDSPLRQDPAYPRAFANLHAFFDAHPISDGAVVAGQRPLAALGYRNLLDLLRAPAQNAPHSLFAQLEFIQQRWAAILGRDLYRLLSGLDLLREEGLYFLQAGGPGGGGPGPSEVYVFAGQEAEPERFSADLDWMPRLVLIAKNTYVWLEQLSRAYDQPITRLDQIPDEELQTLAARGFTGLWLIGLWERSPASQRIKQIMGNEDAVASAYSLFDYRIADDLGGPSAYQDLKDRAWRVGIRLASDMVPNHMGIDSPWVMNHPHWFIQRGDVPYPSYTFNGPDLSWNPDVTIQLEDHYYDRTDAAVVFKRIDKRTGATTYIYHGNDGTSTPWNDTAQLNYLMAEVREAVIQTILHVARQFPVIRFDAAMTLAKKHYQRLWFPEPGTGGGIPSRAEFGLTRAEFDAAMPVEFWREVVDRVAQEAPETLLLAEAFWLMEGYFVRSLGMHRVYNSAFMNMLRDEDNAKYRQLIKNTLEFDPEILKRYVNFMNNPDERTAVDQFGRGDKYFGVATVMATMPGLPMFGHGQVEGFTEKYGMEFRRALWEETPDAYLIGRHEREIAPLLQQRYLFAGVDQFLLYDFVQADGYVNEDVFAYSNRVGDERALVVYHNRYADIRGWIKTAAPFLDKSGPESDRRMVHRTLAEGLAVKRGGGLFTVFRDHITGLEYIRSNDEMLDKGLYIELGAYRYQVFMDFREVRDSEWKQYARLAQRLSGRGVPSIEEALRELMLVPVRAPYSDVVNADVFRRLITVLSAPEPTREPDDRRVDDHAAAVTEEIDGLLSAREEDTRPVADETFEQAEADTEAEAGVTPAGEPVAALDPLDDAEQRVERMLTQIKAFTGGTGDPVALAAEIRRELEAIGRLPALADDDDGPEAGTLREAVAYLNSRLDHQPGVWGGLLGWVFTHSLGKVQTEDDFEQQSRTWIDEWRLGRILGPTVQELGATEADANQAVAAVRIFTAHQASFDTDRSPRRQAYQVLEAWLKDRDIQQFLQINRYQGTLWYNKEAFDRLLWGMFIRAAVRLTSQPDSTMAEVAPALVQRYEIVQQLQRAEAESKYKVEALLAGLRGKPVVTAPQTTVSAAPPADDDAAGDGSIPPTQPSPLSGEGLGDDGNAAS